MNALNSAETCATIRQNNTLRRRDLATALGTSDAALIAASIGPSARRIDFSTDRLFPADCGLGDVMALSRTESAMHERAGVYENWHSEPRAAMVLGPEIDTRIFPKHWVRGFALRRDDLDKGPSRSLQVFDAYGPFARKVCPGEKTDLDARDRAIDELASGDTSNGVAVSDPPPLERPKSIPAQAEPLREEWRRIKDTHQFLRLVSQLKMNWLGAYQIASAPLARQLEPKAAGQVLAKVSGDGFPIMLLVGNGGCLQIHGEPVEPLTRMGPWKNLLEPPINPNLRDDQITEVWLAQKPTKRRMAQLVEAFGAEGRLIMQIFGLRNETADHSEAFAELAENPQFIEVTR